MNYEQVEVLVLRDGRVLRTVNEFRQAGDAAVQDAIRTTTAMGVPDEVTPARARRIAFRDCVYAAALIIERFPEGHFSIYKDVLCGTEDECPKVRGLDRDEVAAVVNTYATKLR